MASGSSSSGNEGVTNFLKLQNLFGASTSQIYRRHLITLWNHYFGASSGEWQNTKDFVDKKFISLGIGKEIYDSCDENEKRILRAGNISLWDLSLLLDVIRKLQNKIKKSITDGGIQFLSEEKLDETKILWDEVDYQSRIIVDYKNYGNWMTKVIKVLEENGMTKDKIFTTAFFLEKPAEDILELDDVGKLSEKLKQDGNLAFGKKEFEKALKFYTDAIELDWLPEELLGTLYSNRSLCNIHLNKVADAKFDAKCAMTLRPSWFKGYLRIGRVFEAMDEFNPASQFYMLAEVLQPGNKEVAAAIKSCKFKKDNRQVQNSALRNIQLLEKHVINRNPEQIAMEKELVRQEDPFSLCREAAFYVDGDWGYPQDYKKAAEFYSKAAAKGYPGGIFGMAGLLEAGRGVPKDVPKALEMYRQAASMDAFQDDPIRGIVRIEGVVYAQLALGIFYNKGEIVPRDLELAISWYKKALGNGCYLAPMHLGNIYLYREKLNVSLASLHFMMASYMGNGMAMEELATAFLGMKNPVVAQKWWKLAVHCGSIKMKQKEHLFMKENLTPDFDPLVFRAEMKMHLKSSVEFKDLMKQFENPKFSWVREMWDASFYKFDEIPEEEERELCKAMKNM